MNRRRILQGVLLALAVLLTLLSAMPVADVPVRVYENTALIVPVCAFLAAAASWGSLAVSPKRRRDAAAACGLNLLAVWFLCRALMDLMDCYTYYVTG